MEYPLFNEEIVLKQRSDHRTALQRVEDDEKSKETHADRSDWRLQNKRSLYQRVHRIPRRVRFTAAEV